MRKHIVSDARGIVAPVFTYYTYEEKEITIKHKFTTSPGLCKYKTGEIIELIHNPKVPGQYHLCGINVRNRLGVFLICLDVISLVSAAIMVILSTL